MKMITAITMGSMLTFTSLFGADFAVDKAHSNLGFKVRHMMISNTQGNFEEFSGTFSYDPKTRQLEALDGEVKVASVNTDEADRDANLRSAEFFDASKYPTMTMKFVEQKGDKVTVALTM
ncbi:MAG: YceI family protein, partial [Thiovulaceae bacterium]|nr:YceI family protein [Sulfurimonadaceae bacterium]